MDAQSREPRGVAGDVTRWLVAAGEGGAKLVPGWLRPQRGEQRWSAMAVIVVAIVLQVLLPDKFVLRPRTAAPILEGVMVVVLAAMNPGRRLDERRSVLRKLLIALISVLAVTNTVSIGLLVHFIVTGVNTTATKILASGASVWITNVIVFALWYWAWDRGGPAERAIAPRSKVDFLFPQMADPRLDPEWQPTFVDYLYVSFTNATAFSPTDTMPLTRWAKMLMLVQSGVSLITVGLVAARAVNILPGH
jgi:uncharacterized membrane protein